MNPKLAMLAMLHALGGLGPIPSMDDGCSDPPGAIPPKPPTVRQAPQAQPPLTPQQRKERQKLLKQKRLA